MYPGSYHLERPKENVYKSKESTIRFVSRREELLGIIASLECELNAIAEHNMLYINSLWMQIYELQQKVAEVDCMQRCEPSTNYTFLQESTQHSNVSPTDFYVKQESAAPQDSLDFSEWAPYIVKSPVLLALWNKGVSDPDTKAEWYLETLSTSQSELQDPLYSKVIDLLVESFEIDPERLLICFLRDHFKQIQKLVQECEIQNQPQLEQKPILLSPKSDGKWQYKFQNVFETISVVWEEFDQGLHGAESIHILEQKFGTYWRKGPNSALSKSFTRRKTLYQFFIHGIRKEKISPKSIIEKLNLLASNQGTKKKKATVTWFNQHYKKLLKEMYGVTTLSHIDIKCDY